MPFSEPSVLYINVTVDDIANSSTGQTTNSLATALKRLRDSFSLAGIVTSSDVTLCNVIQAYTNVNYTPTMVIIGQAYVCTAPYGLDATSALNVLLENVAGIKPSGAYTATLTLL